MKTYFKVFTIILLVSCSKSKPFDVHDNPTYDAYLSATSYDFFFKEVENKTTNTNLKSVLQKQINVLDKIDENRVSLESKFYEENTEDVGNQILTLEKLYKDWEKNAKDLIEKNQLSKDWGIYNKSVETKVNEKTNKSSNNEQLEDEIRTIMSASEIPCLDVGIAESGCLWVYTTDNGENRDGLAQSLCYTSRKYSVNCVSIFDVKQKKLGSFSY